MNDAPSAIMLSFILSFFVSGVILSCFNSADALGAFILTIFLSIMVLYPKRKTGVIVNE